MKRLGLVGALVATAALASTAQPARAQMPPTLAPESFSCLESGGFTIAGCPGGGPATATCSATATSATFQVSGFAAGMYPGTFTEHGHIQLGPPRTEIPNLGARPLTGFSAEFTIDSVFGRVTGTKFLTPELIAAQGGFEFGSGSCTNTPAPSRPLVHSEFVACYEAVLPDGTRDRGYTTGILAINQTASGVQITGFNEGFHVDPGVCRAEPETKDECKAGGVADFGELFRNQGDCVSFVASKGKNEAGKNLPPLPTP